MAQMTRDFGARYSQDRRQGSRRLRRQLVEFDKRRYAVRRIERSTDDRATPLLVKIATAVILLYLVVIIMVVL